MGDPDYGTRRLRQLMDREAGADATRKFSSVIPNILASLVALLEVCTGLANVEPPDSCCKSIVDPRSPLTSNYWAEVRCYGLFLHYDFEYRIC